MMARNNLPAILVCLMILLVLGALSWFYTNVPSGDGTNPGQQKYLDSLKPTAMTQKEKDYMQTLKERGFKDIKFDIPIIGDLGKSRSIYKIELGCSFGLTTANTDSVIQANKDIAEELYTSVIADSMIEDFGLLTIEFKIDKSRIEVRKWHHLLVREYSKAMLEKWCGFRVIKHTSQSFERIPL